jgi:hypothetical protein
MPQNLKYSDNWFRDVDRRMKQQEAEIKALKAKFLTFAADYTVSAVQPSQGQTAVDASNDSFTWFSNGAWHISGGSFFTAGTPIMHTDFDGGPIADPDPNSILCEGWSVQVNNYIIGQFLCSWGPGFTSPHTVPYYGPAGGEYWVELPGTPGIANPVVGASVLVGMGVGRSNFYDVGADQFAMGFYPVETGFGNALAPRGGLNWGALSIGNGDVINVDNATSGDLVTGTYFYQTA